MGSWNLDKIYNNADINERQVVSTNANDLIISKNMSMSVPAD